MPNHEDQILEARLFEHIKEDHPDLFDRIECEEQVINEETKNLFAFSGDNDRRLTFSVWDKGLSYQFLDYHSGISLFPHPEKGFEAFIEMVRDIMGDQKVVVTWSFDEPDAFAEIVPCGEESSYDFLWEDAKKVSISSWSGKLDRALK